MSPFSSSLELGRSSRLLIPLTSALHVSMCHRHLTRGKTARQIQVPHAWRSGNPKCRRRDLTL